MSDENDPVEYLDRHFRAAKIHTGEDVTPDSVYRSMLKLNQNERTAVLTEIDNRLAYSSLSVEKAAKLHRMRARMIDAHQLATKLSR